MNYRVRRCVAFLLLALAPATCVLATGCGGGVSADRPILPPGDDASAQCTVLPCRSNEAWDPVGCACLVIAQITDAAPSCRALRCVAGDVVEIVNGECACVAIGSPSGDDASSPIEVADATEDITADDSPLVLYDEGPPDQFVSDADTGPCAFYPSNYCSTGYELNDSCYCVPCTNTCPAGQTPGQNCNGCIACSTLCPQGFEAGPNCGCVPTGTVPGPVDGGPQCTIASNYPCAAGSWCPFGTCPDQKTQYGCYCDGSGKATCQLACPEPPPCTIPGQGTCPYGAECLYGSCTSGGDTQLLCYCNSNASANCSTVSCESGFALPDAGNPSGVTCLLEGSINCNAGTFCSIGTCPDGKTQIGCFCNTDGTATCDLTCPPPAPCVIPGEGTCPYGSTCTFGTCNSSSGAVLSCYCYGSSASCSTTPCQGIFDAGAPSD